MYNTAKVDYLLCGSLEDEEKAKIIEQMVPCKYVGGLGREGGREGWGGMCGRGLSCVSGRHNVSVTRGQGCLYL